MASTSGLFSLEPDEKVLKSEPLELSGSEAFESALLLGSMDAPMYAGQRAIEQHQLEEQTKDRPKLSPEELNKKYPSGEFTEAMTEPVAQLIHRSKIMRKDLEKRVQAGPQTGWWGAANKWGANILAHVIDPVEIAAGLVVGPAIKVAAPAFAAKLGIGAATSTVGQSIARNSVEGVIQSAVDLGINAYNSQQEQRDFDATEAMIGAVGGAVGFSAIAGGIKLGSNKLNNFLGRVSGKHAETLQRTAVAQTLNGNKVDADGVLGELISDTNIPNPAFKKIPKEQIGESVFYSPKDITTKDIGASTAVISDDLGTGIYFTDDVKIANGAAARKLNDYDGSIIAGKIKDANLIDLDEIVPDPIFRDAAKSALEGVRGADNVKIDVDNLSGKGLFNAIHDAIEDGRLPKEFLNILKVEAKIRGIDGYRFTVDEIAGMPHAPHNGIMLFEANKFVQEKNFLPDTDAVPRIPKQKAQELHEFNQSEKSSIFYDEAATKEFNDVLVKPPLDPIPVKIKQLVDNNIKEIDAKIKVAGEDSPAAKELLKLKEEITESLKIGEQEDTVIKAIFDCLRGA